MLIFERSAPGRVNPAQHPRRREASDDIPRRFLRNAPPPLPAVSELQAVRHYTRLSQKNFSIDTHFYPLGSCTMKYNPRGSNDAALLAGFAGRHPAAHDALSQGAMACFHELQEILMAATGMAAVSLAPMAGAQGEFAGISMIRAWHDARGDRERSEILVPDAAHGTNPASAVMCGYRVREIPTNADGDIDVAALRAAVGPQTAGIMLTNPSTLGVFDRNILELSDIIHGVGGLLYYDGANLNAILGKARPGDMGFDVVHINLHKTFSTPHGGGGPGAGPVGVCEQLIPYLPIPLAARDGDRYHWLTEKERPHSIGRLSAWSGNAGILLRAWAYARMLGREGLERASEYAVLNANYLMTRLAAAGFDMALPKRRASHEFIVTLKRQAREQGVVAMDVAKRLLDFGFHAPTAYFPLLIPECLLIEPTETEDKETLDAFIAAMTQILREAGEEPERLKQAPHTLPLRRLDEVRAAREPDLVWQGRRRDAVGAPTAPTARGQ